MEQGDQVKGNFLYAEPSKYAVQHVAIREQTAGAGGTEPSRANPAQLSVEGAPTWACVGPEMLLNKKLSCIYAYSYIAGLKVSQV